MAGQRQPTDLVVMNGRKHLTKAEIEARKNAEGHSTMRQSETSVIFDTGAKETVPEDCERITRNQTDFKP